MNTRRDVCLILLLAAGVLGLQIAFKTRPDAKEVNQIKNLMASQLSYESQYAPDFTLDQGAGGPFTLSEHLGRQVVVLHFFTTWCPAARDGLPELEHFVKQHDGQPLAFLAIGVGADTAELRAFAKKMKLTMPMAADEDKRVDAQYQIRCYPTTVVIQPDGRIILYESGAIANANVTLTPVIKKWLAGLAKNPGGMSLADYRSLAPVQLPKIGGDDDDDDDDGEDGGAFKGVKAPRAKGRAQP